MKTWLALARQEAEHALAAAVREDGHRVTCRGKGCGACCQGLVAAVADEAEAILALPLDAATLERVRSYEIAKPCPLLDPTTQACIAYAQRPLTCRVYVSYSPAAWCGDNRRVGRTERPRLGRLLQRLYGDRDVGVIGELLRAALG